MKRSSLILIPIALPILAIDVALFLSGGLVSISILATMVTFAAVVIVFWLLRMRGRKVEKDERTIALARKALAYSWMVSVYAVTLLIGSDSLGVLRLSGLQYLGIVMMVMTFSYLILSVILSRRGNVE